MPEIRGPSPLCGDDGDTRIGQRDDQRRDDVARDAGVRVEDDDGLVGHPAHGGTRGRAGSEGQCGPHDLAGVGQSLGRELAGSHGEERGVRRDVSSQGRQRLPHGRPRPGDEDDAGAGTVRLIRQGGDGIRRPDAAALADHGIRRSRWQQLEAQAVIDDPPARRLDAQPEVVGAAPLASRAGLGTLARQRDDLRGGCWLVHVGQHIASASRYP